ncbi:MAG: biosynthetic peptidoglycan transglycosylase, partial [Pseudomonadota bacterium]
MSMTFRALQPPPATLTFDNSEARKVQVRDRHRTPLTVTYQNRWNLHDYKPLHDIPEPLRQLFILAEDKRFFEHGGVDWWARLNALVQNISAGRAVRGASTITEQVVRMVHPRPRNLWSRWVEGFEAARLEAKFTKADILEFYLNQVPYAAQRRGVVQAARYYFDRDLDTLSRKEMLALAVLVRSPSRLDLRRNPGGIEKPLMRLAVRAQEADMLNAEQYQALSQESLALNQSSLPVQAVHFVRYLYNHDPNIIDARLDTTLDADLQQLTQTLLDNRLGELTGKNVKNGAVLIVDHTTREILAWANAGNLDPKVPGSQIDAVT